MIEFLILIVPGIIATFLHSRFNSGPNRSNTWKNITLSFIIYSVCINFLIYGALWMVGTRQFDLFSMSLRFKIKWILLGTILALLLVISYKNLRSISLTSLKNMLNRLIPASLLLTVTYAVYTPSSLFLENIEEFLFSYINIIPIIITIALTLFILINVAALCITNENNVIYYISLVFTISLGAYIQRNFLNPQFPTLDGTDIDWDLYVFEGRISVLSWLLIILVILAVTFYYKEKSERVMKYIAYFLSSVQIISLIVLLITVRLPEEANHGYSTEDQFTVGYDENIIIFVVDTLQASCMEEYLTSGHYPEGQLDDFTFFNNMVSGGANTTVAMPILLTGIEYDPMQSREEYKEEIWDNVPFYDQLHEKGYDIRFFSDNASIIGNLDNIAENYQITVTSHIDNYTGYGKQLYKLVNFYLMPQFLKKHFWSSTEAFMDTIENADDSYKKGNIKFYNDFQTAGGLSAGYDKAFRLYHIYGVHQPYTLNENIETIDEEYGTEQKQLQGIMKMLTLFIDEMKRLGVYDSSTIVITGDHGRHETDNPESNPGFLIKLPYESHELAWNSNPVHFRNLAATLAGTVMDDYSFYGPSIYDITYDSDVERLHTIDRGIRNRNYIDDVWDDNNSYCRLIVPYDPENLDAYNIWDPYKINHINYSLGDVIDYTSENDYSDQINYRLYKENGAATASNELSICFELTDYKKGDLDFHFTYSKVYNDEQNIRIYANGSKVGEIACTTGDAGIDNILTIPKNKLDGSELVIRMVFPNAVTPNQLDRSNPDTRILSVEFTSMRLE